MTLETLEAEFIALLRKLKSFASEVVSDLKPLIDHVAADLRHDLVLDGSLAVTAALAAAGEGPQAMQAAAVEAVTKAAATQGMAELSYVTTQAKALNAVAQAQVQLGQSPVNKPVTNQ